MDIKKYLKNSISYNLEIITKANSFLGEYLDPPENKAERQTAMLVAQDLGKRIVRLSELLKIYEDVLGESYGELDPNIFEQIKLSRGDFLHLKNDQLAVPSGISLVETISKIKQNQDNDE